MKKSLIFRLLVVSVLTAISMFGQSGPTNSQAASQGQSAGKIGSGAVWSPPADFNTKAHVACEKREPTKFAECFIGEMKNSGAPAEAIAFTRRLYRESDGQVGILLAFQNAGPVDLARVLFPLRANDNYGLLVVNGEPAILDVDDRKKLDRPALEQDSFFQSIKQKYPQADLWPGDRSGDMWPRTIAVAGGGEQIILGYPLLNGCHACAHVGLARFSWNFDAKGKFLGTKLISSPPPPKLTQPRHGPLVTPPPAQPPSAQ